MAWQERVLGQFGTRMSANELDVICKDFGGGTRRCTKTQFVLGMLFKLKLVSRDEVDRMASCHTHTLTYIYTYNHGCSNMRSVCARVPCPFRRRRHGTRFCVVSHIISRFDLKRHNDARYILYCYIGTKIKVGSLRSAD